MDIYTMAKDALGMFLFLGVELSVLFILISAGVILLQEYIPDTKIQSILGSSHGKSYIWAGLLGAITPFCSCSTIPMLRGLLRAKAGFGPTLTFLFTSPLLNPIILGLFWITFGAKVTLIYAGIALLVSIVAGIVLDVMNFEKYVIPENAFTSSGSCCDKSKETKPQTVSCCAESKKIELQTISCCSEAKEIKPETVPCCDKAQEAKPQTASCCSESKEKTVSTSCCGKAEQKAVSPTSFKQKVKKSFRESLVQFKQVLPYLLIGVSLGSLIYGFVPSEFIAKYASGDSLFSVPVAAIIGIPLYVRVEALIPLSAVLVSKGMGLGAVMALIIGGGGASLTELILLKSMFRLPMLIAFLVVILGMAICAGYLFQYLL